MNSRHIATVPNWFPWSVPIIPLIRVSVSVALGLAVVAHIVEALATVAASSLGIG